MNHEPFEIFPAAQIATQIEQETRLLEQLSALAAGTRRAAVERRTKEIHELVSSQEKLIARIEEFRLFRSSQIDKMKRNQGDLLTLLLESLPAERHGQLIEIMDGYTRAIENANRQVNINREFFQAALATVDSTLKAVAQSTRTVTYGKRGTGDSGAVAICFSTNT